ncbi:ATP-binding cassette sub-family A member 2-like [Glandiceps talaboti]
MEDSSCTCGPSYCKSAAFSQLKLLLWKNFTLKKRSLLAVACEVFLPLALFLVFLAARKNEPIQTAPAEYNQAVPLPSAGWIPMLQFFCPETNQTDPYGFPIYTNNRVPELLEFLAMSPEGYPVKIETIEALITFIKGAAAKDDDAEQTADFNDAMNILMGDAFFSTIITDAMTGESNFSKEMDKLHSVIRVTENMESILPENSACQDDTITHESSDNVYDENWTYHSEETEFITLGGDLDLKVPRESTVLLLKLWNSLQFVLCGVNNTINETILDDSDWIEKLDFTEKQLSKFKIMAFLLLRGHPQILYTPNTTDVNRIITKANESLRALDNLAEYSRMLYNSSIKLKDLLDKNETFNFDLYSDQQEMASFSDYSDDIGMGPSPFPDIATLQQLTKSLIKITCFWNSFMSQLNLDIFRPFPDEKSMARFSSEADRRDDIAVIAGLAFETNENGELPTHVIYKLKLNDTYAPASILDEERQWSQVHYHDDSYQSLLFPWLQDVVERAIIEDKVGRPVTEPGVYIREFPHPCRRYDEFMHHISTSLSMLFILAWIFHVIIFTKSIVHEKEQRLKEMMKIMGLSNFIYWLSWFITCLVEISITATLLLIIMKCGQLFPYSDPFLLWLYFMLNAVSTVLFSFFLSAFFSKAKLAAACSGILYIIICLPFWYILNMENTSYATVSLPVKIFTCLVSQSAHNLGIRYILQHEQQANGLQWSTINTPWPDYSQDITIGNITLFIVLDWFIYMIILWYLEAVYPGTYGVPQPWYFPFLKSYWCGGDSDGDTCLDKHRGLHEGETEDVLYNIFNVTAPDNPQTSQSIHEDNRVGICIKRLVKVYRKGKAQAVKSLSLNLYEDQITALLGHNGAGKTTIMSILTGFITPSSGTAIIYGRDIRREMVQIRQSLGICPQYNALFEKLTVQEHLWFYSKIKDAPMKCFKSETDRLLTDMGLYNKKHSTIKTLSGGMKRKLSVAVAFTGGAKTVILDEPTAGVDPYARRAIWDLLQKYKQGRTILLSTHHMDEASLLGDRIAILSNGQLKCCGPPQYLKANFGVGYQLTLVKDKGIDKFDKGRTESRTTIPRQVGTGQLYGLQLASVTSFIQQYLPLAEFKSQSDHELLYQVPVKATPKSKFIQLFDALCNNKDNLGISSFGMTETTLEQIFLKVMHDDVPNYTLNNGNCTDNLEPDCGLHNDTTVVGNGVVVGEEVTMNGFEQNNTSKVQGEKRKHNL